MNDRVIAILLELHSEYDHGPAVYALIEEALGLMSPEQPLLGVDTQEDERGVRSMTWTDGTTGVPWLAYLVWQGEKYGIFPTGLPSDGRALTNVDACLVEFWDRRYPHDPVHKAQFVSRYHLRTLLDHQGGLNLCGHEPSWQIDDRSFAMVHRYLLRPAAHRLLRPV